MLPRKQRTGEEEEEEEKEKEETKTKNSFFSFSSLVQSFSASCQHRQSQTLLRLPPALPLGETRAHIRLSSVREGIASDPLGASSVAKEAKCR